MSSSLSLGPSLLAIIEGERTSVVFGIYNQLLTYLARRKEGTKQQQPRTRRIGQYISMERSR